MIRDDFIAKVPGAIEHKLRGYCELIIIIDSKSTKAAAYQDRNGRRNGESQGATWDEVCKVIMRSMKL